MGDKKSCICSNSNRFCTAGAPLKIIRFSNVLRFVTFWASRTPFAIFIVRAVMWRKELAGDAEDMHDLICMVTRLKQPPPMYNLQGLTWRANIGMLILLIIASLLLL